MIVAFEGPDCSGKTTMLREAMIYFPGAFVVKRVKCGVMDIANMTHINRHLVALWDAMYDPYRMYLCDRFFAVSEPVYGTFYGRDVPDFSKWYPRVRVLYFDVPIDELRRRHAVRGDETFDSDNYVGIVSLYHKHLKNFDSRNVEPGDSVDYVADRIAGWWKADEVNRPIGQLVVCK